MTAARIPVLYLLHGNNGDANDWITQGHLQSAADALIEHKDMPPVAIVMPQGGTDWYVDRKEKMETAFFDDLLPEIETRYAVVDATRRTDDRRRLDGRLRRAALRDDATGAVLRRAAAEPRDLSRTSRRARRLRAASACSASGSSIRVSGTSSTIRRNGTVT